MSPKLAMITRSTKAGRLVAESLALKGRLIGGLAVKNLNAEFFSIDGHGNWDKTVLSKDSTCIRLSIGSNLTRQLRRGQVSEA